VEDGNPETNRKIDKDVPTFLGWSQGNDRSRRYLVQATIDHKQRCQYPNTEADDEASGWGGQISELVMTGEGRIVRTYVTPNRGYICDRVVPDDRVDEEVQTA